MNFTFGIITDGSQPERLAAIFKSIEQQNIPNYEILVVGGKNIVRHNVTHIPFEETTEKAWITKKKNLVTQNAIYENIVYLHDYFALDKDWYKGWLQFGNDFEVAINKVWMLEEDTIYRHADWMINPYDYWKVFPEWHWTNWDVGLPYDTRGLEKIQYISGGYWLAKKAFMERFPLDEKLFWGDSEDCRWSEIAREHTTFKFNPDAITWLIKPGKWKVNEISPYCLNAVKNHFEL
jgi:hypothetical protein